MKCPIHGEELDTANNCQQCINANYQNSYVGRKDMSLPRNVYAYTECENYEYYPAYISINEVGGELRLTVRSRDENGEQVAMCALPKGEVMDLIHKLAALVT